MKNIKFIITNLLILITCINFIACSNDDNDDNDENNTSLLIGSWEGEYDTYTFMANGKGMYYEKSVEYFAYNYNENKETLKLYFGDEVEIYTVIKLTKTTLILEDEYGQFTYTKVNDDNEEESYRSLIIGTWQRDVKNSSGTIDYSIKFIFKSNGNGMVYEIDGSADHGSPISYTCSSTTLTITDLEDGEKEKFTIRRLNTDALIIIDESGDILEFRKKK